MNFFIFLEYIHTLICFWTLLESIPKNEGFLHFAKYSALNKEKESIYLK